MLSTEYMVGHGLLCPFLLKQNRSQNPADLQALGGFDIISHKVVTYFKT